LIRKSKRVAIIVSVVVNLNLPVVALVVVVTVVVATVHTNRLPVGRVMLIQAVAVVTQVWGLVQLIPGVLAALVLSLSGTNFNR